MWIGVDDCGELVVDLIFANLHNPTPGGSSILPLRDRAVHLVESSHTTALVVVGEAMGAQTGSFAVTATAQTASSLPATACSQNVTTYLSSLERPIRVAAQRWDMWALDALNLLERTGVELDPATRPQTPATAISYWDSKIGGHEVLTGIPEVRDLLPASTLVADLAEAAAATTTIGRPSVLKVNRGAGGAGIVRLDPANPPLLIAEFERELETSTAAIDGKSKAPVHLTGPYLLQELVGGANAVSPSIDLWIEQDNTHCIALAQQTLDGFKYIGAEFPGRLGHNSAERCVRAAITVGEELRSRGYRGCLNIDFIADGADIWIIELNVRQSAPLDQSLRCARHFGTDWRLSHSFQFLEANNTLELSV